MSRVERWPCAIAHGTECRWRDLIRVNPTFLYLKGEHLDSNLVLFVFDSCGFVDRPRFPTE
jgi:hypothetical protein